MIEKLYSQLREAPTTRTSPAILGATTDSMSAAQRATVSSRTMQRGEKSTRHVRTIRRVPYVPSHTRRVCRTWRYDPLRHARRNIPGLLATNDHCLCRVPIFSSEGSCL